MGMDEAGLTLVAHFQRRGDTEGLRLLYIYSTQVEKLLKDKQVLTISRSELPKNGKSILDQPNPTKLKKVVEQHHISESNARVSARKIINVLRAQEPARRYEMLHDDTLLHDWAKQYRIHGDHVLLFVNLVRAGVEG